MKKVLLLLLILMIINVGIVKGTIQDAVDNAMAYYPAENNRNDLINSSQNLAMTLPNMTDDYTSGIIGQAFYSKLKGVNESCSVNECGNSSRYNTTINNPQDIFTIDFWARSDFTDGYHRHLLYLYKDLSNDIRISSPCSGAGACGDLAFQIINGSEVCGASSVPGVLLDNEFHHLIFGINGSHFNIWINGTKVNSTPCNVTVGIDWNKLVLGDRPDFTSTSWRWYGAIDNVFITSYPYDDITALDSYNNGNGTNFSFLLAGEPFIPAINSSPENLSFKGNGILPNPYVIESCQHLWSLNINTSAYFVLGNDIDCAGLNWNHTAKDSMSGTLNGRGFSIKNILIDGEDTVKELSMFNQLNTNATIRDLWIQNMTARRSTGFTSLGEGVLFKFADDNSNVTNVHFRNITLDLNDASKYIGAIAGLTNDFNVTNVSVKDMYVKGQFFIGALTGDSDGKFRHIAIEDFTIDGQLGNTSTFEQIGGISGKGNLFECKECYVKDMNISRPIGASITQNLGGILGFGSTPIFIDVYVYNLSLNCTGLTNCGALAGRCGTVTTSYADIETILPFNDIGTNCPSSARKNISDLIAIETYVGFDFATTWTIINGTSPPTFMWDYDNSSIFKSITNSPLSISNLNVTNPDLTEFILIDTFYEYLNGLWNFTFRINDDDTINELNITINDVNSLILSSFSPIIRSVGLSSSLILNENPFRINISVKNLFGDTDFITQQFKINDSTTPNCTGIDNATVNESESFIWSIGCIDESIDFFNITCDEFSELNTSMDKNGFTFNDSFVPTQNNTCIINYKDKFGNSVIDSLFIFFIPTPTVPTPSGNVTIIIGNVFGDGSGSDIAGYNLMEVIFISLIVFVLLSFLFIGFTQRIPALLIIGSVLMMFFGVFIQMARLTLWLNIIGIGLIFMAVVTIAVSFGMANSK